MSLYKEIFKRDVRGDFELNPKEIRLIPLLLPVADKREHEKEHACLPRSLHRLGRRLKDELPELRKSSNGLRTSSSELPIGFPYLT